MRRFLLQLAAAAAAVLWTTPARAETIKIVVPFAAGGPVDMVARLLAQEMAPRLNADMVVENRGGGGGVIAVEAVVRSPPDGRTLLLASMGSYIINSVLRPPAGFEPTTALAPIAMVGAAPSLLVVRPQQGFTRLADLVARAKQTPALSYGSAGPGTTMHIAPEMLNVSAGIKTTHVPYRGAAPAINDLIGGYVDFLIADLTILLPLVQNGSLRALALLATERTPLLPDLPTADEQGFANVLMENWYGLLVPAAVAPAQQATLEKTALEAVKVAAVKERLDAGGVRGTRDRAAFKTKIDGDFAYWRTTIKQLGITAD